MTPDSKGKDLFIVDNSVAGWSGLPYLQQGTTTECAFGVATGQFDKRGLRSPDGE